MDDKRLIDGIIKNAEQEAEEILQKAEKNISEQDSSFNTVLERIRKETDQKISLKLEELSKRAEASVQSETRRRNLRQREKINEEVTATFLDMISDLIPTAEYREFLCKLIAEGAIAVNDSEVRVRASFREEITPEMLKKAEDLVLEETGCRISIKRSDAEPLTGPGVVVESSNGRISYNNQIESRLRRFDEDVKMIIINGLEKE